MIAGIIGTVLVLVIVFLVFIIFGLFIHYTALRMWAEDKTGTTAFGDEQDKYLKAAIDDLF